MLRSLVGSEMCIRDSSNTGEFDNTNLNNGISELGKQVIEKMNYYGMMIDISHPSKEAIRQTIQHTKAPVIASHSSARHLSDHPRNLDDEQLKWVKENGGVVQVVALDEFLNKIKLIKNPIIKPKKCKLISARSKLNPESKMTSFP